MGYPSGCQTRVGSRASCTPLGLHPLAALEPYARNAVISTSPDGGASSLAVDVRITSSELSFRATCSPTRILGPVPACPPPRTPRVAWLARAPPPQSGARLSGAPAVRSRLARHLEGWREDGRGARPAPLTRSARHCRPSPLRTRRALRPERGPRRRLTTARCCHRCRALRRLRRRGAMAAPQRGDVVSSSPVASPLRLLCPHQVAAARANPAGRLIFNAAAHAVDVTWRWCWSSAAKPGTVRAHCGHLMQRRCDGSAE